MKSVFIKITAVCLVIMCILTFSGSTYIKWVDCSVSADILNKVYDYCVKCYGTEKQFDFYKGIAYIATRNGNRFTSKDGKYFKDLVQNVQSGDVAGQYADNKYYKYHEQAYGAVFKNFVGEYVDEGNMDKKFGIKAYFPLAQGFWYNHYDDFGNSRSFGFKRKHLGHDVMGSVGTPIVAVEGGTVTELGWNRYGGWRIGITSDDSQRYYYYAHLRKDKPFADGMETGKSVRAGEVIGFLGQTGYSDKENVNLKNCAPHLHFGMQLIFDESQKEGNGEIWIDVYAICKFLSRNRVKTIKTEDGQVKSVGLRLSVNAV